MEVALPKFEIWLPNHGMTLDSLFDRSNAEDAIQRLNGTVIGKQTVRLSWGRTMGNKQVSLSSSSLAV